MKCKNCGTENFEGREFCKICGDYLEYPVISDEEKSKEKSDSITESEKEIDSASANTQQEKINFDSDELKLNLELQGDSRDSVSDKKNTDTKFYYKIISYCYKEVPEEDISPFSRWIAFLLCVFLGFLGMHRYYVGKIGTGVLYTLTCGLLGIGFLVDAIRIVVGNFTDYKKLYLQK